jgi:hypothetical protein
MNILFIMKVKIFVLTKWPLPQLYWLLIHLEWFIYSEHVVQPILSTWHLFGVIIGCTTKVVELWKLHYIWLVSPILLIVLLNTNHVKGIMGSIPFGNPWQPNNIKKTHLMLSKRFFLQKSRTLFPFLWEGIGLPPPQGLSHYKCLKSWTWHWNWAVVNYPYH